MFSEITALVLAAGSARRMKMPKLFMDFGGIPLISWCLRTIQKVCPGQTILVLGDHYQDALFTLSLMQESEGIEMIINHSFYQGMSTSLKAGISAVRKKTKAILIFLADMPFISPEIVYRIIHAFYETKKEDSIVVPVYEGKQGHPVLLPAFYFPEIQELKGDTGAKSILQKNREKILWLEATTPEVLIDIDTKEEWSKWKNISF